jgi:hypothetical protein
VFAGGSGSTPGSDAGRAGATPADSGPGSPPDAGRSGSGSDAGRGGAAAADSGPPDADRDRGAFAAGSGPASDAPPAGGGFGSRGAGERRGGESWASGAAAGDTRPASAWATGAAASGSSADRPSDADGAQQVDRPNGSASAGSAAEPPARDDQATRATSSSGHDLFEPAAHEGATQQAFPADDAEPPEESADPALGRVAAAVEDEVLVVDEQPRYHLMGCRALAAQQTIPLPAREAVELGFTPCGWCNPVAALGARHPASAR